jgi:hypothetical protein
LLSGELVDVELGGCNLDSCVVVRGLAVGLA